MAGFIADGLRPRSSVSPDEVARKIRLDYLYSQKDLNQKALDGVQTLFEHFHRPEFSLDAFMTDALNLMRRRLWIREVTVALLDRQEKRFRYRYQSGLRKEAWEAHSGIAYKQDEYVNPSVYRAREISRHTSLFLAEDNPYGVGEDATFSRPIMLESKRLAADDSVEGDYFDAWIFGKDKEVVGWIEFSGTTSNKLPDTVALKWVELISSVMSVALIVSESREYRPRGMFPETKVEP